MSKGIALESIIPMRVEASDRAEMVNQVLFGESYEVLEEQEKWVKVQLEHDGYQGWIDRKQHSEISDVPNGLKALCLSPIGKVYAVGSDHHWSIPAGSCLPGLKKGQLEIGGKSFLFQGQKAECLSENLKDYALLYLNSPYLWGGRTPFGIDCSGFTQIVYRLCGMSLPRDASQQINEGREIPFGEHQTGDLVFFNNEKGNITHVGIVFPEGKIIHASGRVRIDQLDEKGIYVEQEKKHSHTYHSIKRIL